MEHPAGAGYLKGKVLGEEVNVAFWLKAEEAPRPPKAPEGPRTNRVIGYHFTHPLPFYT